MPVNPANLSGVVINEIGDTPSGASQDLNGNGVGDSTDEFVELYNTSSSNVDISGWEIWETLELIHVIPAGTILAPGQYYMSVDSDGGTSNTSFANVTPGAIVDYVSGGVDSYSLNDSDSVFLYDPNTNTYVAYQGEDEPSTSTGSGSDHASSVANLLVSHPGASQVGPTIRGVEDESGFSQQLSPSGEAGNMISHTQTPGGPQCFSAGTRIATPSGERKVETLKAGDLVTMADGQAVAVKWLGRMTIDKYAYQERAEPVRISVGALGVGLPRRDLVVTGDHGMILDGLVINASALVNHRTIDFVPMIELPDSITFYHIETEGHVVVMAEGAETETFVDAAGRSTFDNYQEYLDLYLTEKIIPEMDLPRISSRRLLPDAIKARLGLDETPPAFAKQMIG